jgi:hypothetical protein
MAVVPATADEADAYRQLFDRSELYLELRSAWKQANRTLAALSPAEITKLKRRLQRDLDALRGIDFFPSEASVEAEAAWVDFSKRIDAVLSPDEPHETKGRVPRLDPAKYRGRTWATRRRLWVDRVASAWLIRRFIDPEASSAGSPSRPSARRAQSGSTSTAQPSRTSVIASPSRPCWRASVSTATPPSPASQRSFTRSTSAASRCPKRSASKRSWPARASGSQTTTRCWLK